jgi:PGF-pre-PGF domain-containing protein
VKKLFYVFFVMVFLFSAPAIMAQVTTWPVETWFGKVSIGGAETNDTSVIIEAFIGGSKVANVTNGLYATGYYLIDVPTCDQGLQVTLKVYGISASPVQVCQPNDQNRQEFNLSVSKSADSASCTYAAGCSGGFCNSGVCASAAPTTTTTGGGGGGGGMGAAAVQESVTIPTVTTNVPVTATFTNAELGVQSIELTSSAPAVSAAVTVQQSSRPVVAPSPISAAGFVYKYLNITSTLGASITSGKIKFSVTKAWITANNIDVNTIALSRLVNNAWVKLPTTKISEASTLINFEATSPGLSIFVVTGEKVGAAPTPTPAAVCGNGVCEAGETSTNCRQDCPPTPGAVCGNGVCEAGETSTNCRQDCPPAQPPITLPKIEPTPTNIFYAVVIVIIFVVGGIWHYKKRPKKQPGIAQ